MLKFLYKNKINDAFNRGVEQGRMATAIQDISESKESIRKFQEQIRSIKDEENIETIMSLTNSYLSISTERKKIIEEVDNIRKFYLVSVILDQMTQDSLAPNIEDGSIMRVYSNNADINKEIQELNERINFDRLAEDITPDMCAYGSYTLSMEVEENLGVVDIVDNVDQSMVVPLISRVGALGFLSISDNRSSLEIHKPYKFVCFSLFGSKTKVDLLSSGFSGTGSSMSTSIFSGFGMTDGKAVDDKSILPRYIRVGKSVIHPVISKIKELELLEKLVPSSKIANLSRGSILGMSVPTGYEPDKMIKAAQKMEGFVNKKTAYSNRNDSMTADDIINAAGSIKIIPISGDKGSLSRMDYKSTESEDLMSSINDTRETILSSIGYPMENLFSGQGGSKIDSLKRNSRYLRKLRAINQSVAFGIRHIIETHLANRGISYESSDIIVSFRNKIIDISEVENLEFQDAAVSIIRNISDTVMGIATIPGAEKSINLKHFLTEIGNKFTTIGLVGIINSEKISDESQGDGESDDFFGGLSSDSGGGDNDFSSGPIGDFDFSDDSLGQSEPELSPMGNIE